MSIKIHYPKGKKNCNSMFRSIKGSNNLYLFIHLKIEEYSDLEGMVGKKEILFCTSRYFRFKQGLLGHVIIRDMVKQDLLKKINRDKYQVINIEKSKHIKKLMEND